jgi:ketosteroid isomerase-like protein
MRRFIGYVIPLFIAALCLSVQGKAKSQSSSDEKMILALESAWNQAELHHDSKAAASMMADTFVSVDHNGNVSNRAQYLAGLKDESYKPEQISNHDTRVFVYETTAIVTSAYRTRGTADGKPFVHNGRFTDTWVNLSGKWLCVASHETWLAKQ